MTIRRGKIVVEGKQFHGAPTDGQRLSRKIGDAVRSGPAC
jgi:hypothetical protein